MSSTPANDSGFKHISYGVREQLESRDDIDEIAAEMRINGCAVLPSGFDKAFIAGLGNAVDAIYKEQAQEFGGEENLEKISDRDIARGLLAYHPDMLKVAMNPALMELCKRLMGPEFILLQQNAIINRAENKNYQRLWHRDLSYQHWTCTGIIAIAALFCVDDFTAENGATFFLPGTQHVSEFPTEKYIQKFEKQVIAPAGSYFVMNSMLYHRAGNNHSANDRRGINNLIGLPFMVQQIDLPSLIASRNGKEPADADTRKFLGYRWSPASTVTQWRNRKK